MTLTPDGQPHILIAEDDEELRALLALTLLKDGYQVTESPDGVDLMCRLGGFAAGGDEWTNFDVVVSDIRLPGVSGLDVVERLRDSNRLPPTILITGFGDEDTHRRASRVGAVLFDKPFALGALLAKVREIAPHPARLEP